MSKSISKKTSYNIMASGILEVVTLVGGLILPRFILRKFGSADNGLISSITQFLNYIDILTLGVAGPTRVALYRSLSRNDMRETSAILKATTRFYRKVAVLFALYMLVLAGVFPFVVKSEHEWFEVSLLVIIIGIGVLFEYCFGLAFSCLVQADQSEYVYTIIKIVCRVLNTLVTIGLIYADFSLFIVKLGSTVFNAMQPLALYFIVIRKYRFEKDVEPNTKALKQRSDAAASSIANFIHNKTDIVILTVFTDTLTVSVYSVYMIVMNGLISVVRVFTHALEAPFGVLWAKGDIEGVRRNLSLYEFFIFSFTAVVFSCTGLLVLPFITLYTHNVTDINYVIPAFAVLTTIATAVFCIRQPYVTVVQAAGKYKETKIGSFIEAGLNIGISILAVIKFGLIGVTVGTIVANLFRTVQYAMYVSIKLIHRSILEVVKRVIWAIAIVGIVLKFYSFFMQLIFYRSWLEWCLSGVLCFIISTFVTVLMAIVFYKRDLSAVFMIIKRMMFKEDTGNKEK